MRRAIKTTTRGPWRLVGLRIIHEPTSYAVPVHTEALHAGIALEHALAQPWCTGDVATELCSLWNELVGGK